VLFTYISLLEVCKTISFCNFDSKSRKNILYITWVFPPPRKKLPTTRPLPCLRSASRNYVVGYCIHRMLKPTLLVNKYTMLTQWKFGNVTGLSIFCGRCIRSYWSVTKKCKIRSLSWALSLIHFMAGWCRRQPESGFSFLGLVLLMLVVFISCCLGFLCSHVVVVIFGFARTSQVIA